MENAMLSFETERKMSASENKGGGAKVSKCMVIVFIVLGILLAGSVGFFVFLWFETSSKQTEFDSQKALEDDLRLNVSNLTNVIEKQQIEIRDLQTQINDSKNATDTYKAQWRVLNETAKYQEGIIASLHTANQWLNVAGGTAVGVALAGGAGAVIEYLRIPPLDAQIKALKEELETTIKKYMTYFEKTKLALMDGLIFLNPFPNLKVIYNSNDNFTRAAFYEKVKDKANTVTLITTHTGHTIAVRLSSPWRADEGEIADKNALTASVWNVNFATIVHGNASRAAVVSRDTFLQFGDKEIVIYENRTGIAIANRTFTPSVLTSDWTNETFYAPNSHFNVSHIQVFVSP